MLPWTQRAKDERLEEQALIACVADRLTDCGCNCGCPRSPSALAGHACCWPCHPRASSSSDRGCNCGSPSALAGHACRWPCHPRASSSSDRGCNCGCSRSPSALAGHACHRPCHPCASSSSIGR
eukprot:4297316-Amphidinium_carterae.1